MPEAWSIDSLPDAFAPPPQAAPGKGGQLQPNVEHGGRLVVNIYQPKTGQQAWSIDSLPDYDPKTEVLQHPISAGEAAGRGAIDAGTFGLAPAMMGAAAAGATGEQMPASMGGEFPGMETLATGAERLTRGEPVARAASEQARKETLAAQEAAQQQHPNYYLAGELGGSIATPGFGAGALVKPAATTIKLVGPKLAPVVTRAISGQVAGGVGGGLYGAGRTVSEGGGVPEIIGGGARGASLGAAAGGVIKGAIGPRAAKAVETPAQLAARKGVEIKAPLPTGLTGGPVSQVTTAGLQSLPFTGEQISKPVRKFGEKFGEHIEGIGSEMGGGAGREGAKAVVNRGLQGVLDKNKAAINRAYTGVRSYFNRDQPYTMPRTGAAVNEVIRSRAAAHDPNPAEGLERFQSAAEGSTFEGAQRLKSWARTGINYLNPHRGYDANDYDVIANAMAADMREMAAHAGGEKAVAQFDHAEKEFGRLSELNRQLSDLINAEGTGGIGSLIKAAQEKGGNIELLAELRKSMEPEDFEILGGTILHELGRAANKDFSPARFASDWGKLSDGAKRVLFPSSHKDIQEFVDAAKFLNKALEKSNRSHTTGALLLFDTLKTIGEFAIAAGAGAVDWSYGLDVGGGIIGAHLLTFWLARPRTAASIRAWGNAYKGVVVNPTPARVASFKIATRNLANNLGLPEDKVLSIIQSKANEQSDPNNK